MSEPIEIPTESLEYRTEVKQLLDILAHSLYTDREIFLRELISNASDALNRIQFEMLTNHEVVEPDAELAIQIEVDDDAKVITIRDSGIGMNRDEMVENLGTIAHSDPSVGYAIIGDSAASAKVYGVGKTITGGTKLHAVYADRVILDRGGKLEALLLPKKFTGGGTVAAAPLPQAGSPMLGQRLQELAAQNPGAITEIIRPQPVFANGQQRGYRVYPGRNRQQFARLGLMPGDLVTAINGTPLDDPARGMEILQSMNSATQVTVTVERNGQSSQININNAAVAAESAAAALPEAIPVSEVPEASVNTDPAE